MLLEVLSKATTRTSSSVSKLSAKRNTMMDLMVTGFGCPICNIRVTFGDEKELDCLSERKLG